MPEPSCASVTQTISVLDSVDMIHSDPPIETSLPVEANPVPDIVKVVPPAVPPLSGEIEVISELRLESYVNPPAEMTEEFPGFFTVTSQVSTELPPEIIKQKI